jgi:hypothetical protein
MSSASEKKQLRQLRVEEGKCSRCGGKKNDYQYRLCELCRAKKRARRLTQREESRRWREKNPEKYRDHQTRARYKKIYGRTPDEIQALLEAQDGRCKICSREILIGGRKLNSMAVDHCHESGEVRGILCSACNRGLGLFRDDPDSLRKAATYLEKETSDGV